MGIFGPSEAMSWNQSICLRVVTHASRSAKPESAAGSPIPAIFGPSSPASFAYFDPASSCWKTYQATFLSGLEQFSETWPDSGTMRSGCVYERQISARPTCESGSLLWPTAQAHDAQGAKTPEQVEAMRAKGHGVSNLNESAARWPTARSEDSESYGNHPGASDSLTGVSRNWSTPRTITGGGESAERKKELGRENSGGGDLQAQVDTWLTPHGMFGTDHTGKTGRGGEFAKQANQWQTPATDSFRSRGGDRVDEMGLDQQARFFPTPQSRDWKSGDASEATANKNARPLNEIAERWNTPHAPRANDSNNSESTYLGGQVASLQDLAIPDGPPLSAQGQTLRRQSQPIHRQGTLRELVRKNALSVSQGAGADNYESNSPLKSNWLSLRESHGRNRLSPRFVEWLMGVPMGHTETND